MARENLFKAKRLDNGEWVIGCLLKDGLTGQHFIHAEGNSVNESDKVNEEGYFCSLLHLKLMNQPFASTPD